MARDPARTVRCWQPRARLGASWAVLLCFTLCLSAAPRVSHAWPLLFNGDGSALLTSAFGADVLLAPDAGGACKRCGAQ
jgi:hypothetical protein